MSPTISSKKPAPKKSKSVKSKKSMEREQFVFLIVLIAGTATVFLHLIIQTAVYVKKVNQYEKEEKVLASFQAIKLLEQEEKLEKEMEVIARAAEKNLALRKRQREFDERMSMAPEYAHTKTEQNLLQMQKIKNSPDMNPKTALENIAELAVPPRSGYMVEKKRRGYEVTVAFPYKEVQKKFSDRYKDCFPCMVREVKKTAAGIMLDLFRFGKPHNIYRVYVMCQDVSIIKEKGKPDRKETRDTFTVSSRDYKADWEDISRAEVQDVWRVRKNVYD